MTAMRAPRELRAILALTPLLAFLPSAHASAAGSFTLSSAQGGAVRVDVTLRRAWTVPTTRTDIQYKGRGPVSLLVTRASNPSFVATATRWAPLAGEPRGGSTLELDGGFRSPNWGLPAGRYTFTLYCAGPCSITFPSQPSGLPQRLAPRTPARNVTAWSQHILPVAGAPGGVAFHAVGNGDLHGIVLASTGATAARSLTGVAATDVCRLGQMPLCDRTEDGWSKDTRMEQDSTGQTKSVQRFTRVYDDVPGSETTIHRLLITNAVDADAAVLFFPR